MGNMPWPGQHAMQDMPKLPYTFILLYFSLLFDIHVTLAASYTTCNSVLLLFGRRHRYAIFLYSVDVEIDDSLVGQLTRR